MFFRSDQRRITGPACSCHCTFISSHLVPYRTVAEIYSHVANACMGLLHIVEGWANPKYGVRHEASDLGVSR